MFSLVLPSSLRLAVQRPDCRLWSECNVRCCHRHAAWFRRAHWSSFWTTFRWQHIHSTYTAHTQHVHSTYTARAQHNRGFQTILFQGIRVCRKGLTALLPTALLRMELETLKVVTRLSVGDCSSCVADSQSVLLTAGIV